MYTKLLRFYSLSSLICILVAATLLTMLYRSVAIDELVELAQRSNLALAQIAVDSVKPDLVDYLRMVKNAEPQELTGKYKFPSRIVSAFATLMRDTEVVRVKVYNTRSKVVFSTRAEQIGSDQESNNAVALALKGKFSSSLTYRDTFNRFEKETEEDNLMSTYVPVRNSPLEPIEGAFEIYTDVNALVMQNERMEITIMAGVGLILVLLYAGLVLIVRRVAGIIVSQQNTIQERTAALENLSAQMLKSEEMEKKNLAAVLHEGLAQTLNAIKTHLEYGRTGKGGSGLQESLVPVLEGAINDVRTIATDLRPSSLDELGLLPTIRWFFREFEQLHSDIVVEKDISLQEDEVPEHLKVVIFRIIESVFKRIARNDDADRVRLALRRADQSVVLEIDDTSRDSSYGVAAKEMADPQLDIHIVKMRERTTLSGGTFSVTPNAAGGATLRASWMTPNQVSPAP